MAKPSPASAVVGVLLMYPPLVYVTATGHAPTWARIWIGAWLGLWLLVTTAAAARTSN